MCAVFSWIRARLSFFHGTLGCVRVRDFFSQRFLSLCMELFALFMCAGTIVVWLQAYKTAITKILCTSNDSWSALTQFSSNCIMLEKSEWQKTKMIYSSFSWSVSVWTISSLSTLWKQWKCGGGGDGGGYWIDMDRATWPNCRTVILTLVLFVCCCVLMCYEALRLKGGCGGGWRWKTKSTIRHSMNSASDFIHVYPIPKVCIRLRLRFCQNSMLIWNAH